MPSVLRYKSISLKSKAKWNLRHIFSHSVNDVHDQMPPCFFLGSDLLRSISAFDSAINTTASSDYMALSIITIIIIIMIMTTWQRNLQWIAECRQHQRSTFQTCHILPVDRVRFHRGCERSLGRCRCVWTSDSTWTSDNSPDGHVEYLQWNGALYQYLFTYSHKLDGTQWMNKYCWWLGNNIHWWTQSGKDNGIRSVIYSLLRTVLEGKIEGSETRGKPKIKVLRPRNRRRSPSSSSSLRSRTDTSR